MEANAGRLAAIISQESGKPLSEAIGEVTHAASFYELYAEEAKRINGDIIASPVRGQRLLALREPIGPVALITPW